MKKLIKRARSFFFLIWETRFNIVLKKAELNLSKLMFFHNLFIIIINITKYFKT